MMLIICLLRVAAEAAKNRDSGFGRSAAFLSAHTYNMGTLCNGLHFLTYLSHIRRQNMLDRALSTMGCTIYVN